MRWSGALRRFYPGSATSGTKFIPLSGRWKTLYERTAPPLAGNLAALPVGRRRLCRAVPRLSRPRKWCLWFSGLTLACAIGAWLDFQFLDVAEADDRGHFLARLFGHRVLVIDHVSAPLLPLVALLYFLTTIATVRTKVGRYSFPLSLVSEAILLAAYSCTARWGVIGLLAVQTVPPYLEFVLAENQRAFIACTWRSSWRVWWPRGCGSIAAARGAAALGPIVLLAIAIMVRSGVVPLHCWMADLFEHSTFGAALLFVTPMVGAYAAVRLLMPIAPDWILRTVGLFCAFYGLLWCRHGLGPAPARRFFSYHFLSSSSLVLVGLDVISPNGLTGGLCVWLSVGLSLGGLGLTLRALEARRGRISMRDFQGLYEHTPNLAMCFGLTGLAAVGFPGTLGFVGTELLVDGAVEAYPLVGIAVVLAAALNGIAIVQAFFRIFAGGRYVSSVSLQIRGRERYAVLALAALILIGGVLPQPIVASRHRAAEELLHQRNASGAVQCRTHTSN